MALREGDAVFSSSHEKALEKENTITTSSSKTKCQESESGLFCIDAEYYATRTAYIVSIIRSSKARTLTISSSFKKVAYDIICGDQKLKSCS